MCSLLVPGYYPGFCTSLRFPLQEVYIIGTKRDTKASRFESFNGETLTKTKCQKFQRGKSLLCRRSCLVYTSNSINTIFKSLEWNEGWKDSISLWNIWVCAATHLSLFERIAVCVKFLVNQHKDRFPVRGVAGQMHQRPLCPSHDIRSLALPRTIPPLLVVR